MTLLSYNDLCELVEQGVITNVKHDQINSASIDLTLGRTILIEQYDPEKIRPVAYPQSVSLRSRTPLNVKEFDLRGTSYGLYPGDFILASTQQMFNLPNNISAEYKLKSSMARIGLEHLNAGWCDAGWNGSALTLELKNMTRHHIIELDEGVGIGQIVFYCHLPVPADRSYAARGRYNGDTAVSGIKE